MKIVMMALLLSSMSYGTLFNEKSFISKLVGKNVNKLAREVGESSHTKKLVLKKVSLKSPSVEIVSTVAKNISKKSKFGDELISKTNHPTDVLRQYTKYGDDYVDTLSKFSKKSLSLNKVDIQSFKKQFPSMPIIDFKSSQIFNDKMVQTLKYTGKEGWKVSQRLFTLAKKNPRSSAVSVLMAWYVTDPKSFFEHKEKLIDFVASSLKEGASDVTRLTLDASSGVVNGFVSMAKEKMTLGNMMFLFLLFFSFIIWKLRSYIKRYLKLKFENSLQKIKNKSEDNEGLL